MALCFWSYSVFNDRRTGAKIISFHTYNIPFPILEPYFLVHTRNQGVIRWNKNVQHISYFILYPWWTSAGHSKTNFITGSLPVSHHVSCRHGSLAVCIDSLTISLKPNIKIQPTKKIPKPSKPQHHHPQNKPQKGKALTDLPLVRKFPKYLRSKTAGFWRWIDC